MPLGELIDLKVELLSASALGGMDNYVGRDRELHGRQGTEYVRDSNVDFWELEHCGNNIIILDKGQTECIEVGDILFMKGAPTRAPAPRPQVAHASVPRNGRVLHRLILKVDVNSF